MISSPDQSSSSFESSPLLSASSPESSELSTVSSSLYPALVSSPLSLPFYPTSFEISPVLTLSPSLLAPSISSVLSPFLSEGSPPLLVLALSSSTFSPVSFLLSPVSKEFSCASLVPSLTSSVLTPVSSTSCHV